MKTITKVLLAGSILMGMTLSGCGSTSTTPSSQPTAPAKTYYVGTDAAYAPFESQNDQSQIVGFDVDVLNAVAQKAGITLKFVNTPWEGIFKTLDQGDRDILISAITITDERKKSMDFSDKYFEAKQLIAVPKNSPIKKLDDLKGKKVGVQTGTTGDDIVSQLLGKDSPDVKRFESTPLALKELSDGGLNAVVADNGVVINYVKNNSDKGFSMVEDTSFEKEFYGIAVKKGNKELLDKINAGLKQIQDDGTYKTIYEKYFGAAK